MNARIVIAERTINVVKHWDACLKWRLVALLARIKETMSIPWGVASCDLM